MPAELGTPQLENDDESSNGKVTKIEKEKFYREESCCSYYLLFHQLLRGMPKDDFRGSSS